MPEPGDPYRGWSLFDRLQMLAFEAELAHLRRNFSRARLPNPSSSSFAFAVRHVLQQLPGADAECDTEGVERLSVHPLDLAPGGKVRPKKTRRAVKL